MSTARIRLTITVDFNLEELKDYLIRNGWKEDGPYGSYGRLFRKGESGVLLATTDKIGDFNARMSEFFTELSEAEERTVPELLKDLNIKINL